MGEIFRQERSERELFEPLDRRLVRLQRYYLARRLAGGRRVLDLRGGDGSGAAIVAQAADFVRVVMADASERDAARAAFGANNLEFALEEGEGEGAGEGEGWDLVLAFGALEREPAALLERMARLLRPGGVALIGVRNRGREGVREGGGGSGQRFSVDAPGLAALAGRFFGSVRVHGQSGLVGVALHGGGGAERLTFEHRGLLEVEAHAGEPEPDDLVCVAGDGSADGLLPDGLLVAEALGAPARLQARLLEAEAVLERLEAAHAALTRQAAEGAQTHAVRRREMAVLRVDEAAAQSALAEARRRFAEQERIYLPTLARVQARCDAVEAQQAAERVAMAAHLTHQLQIADERRAHEGRVLGEQIRHERRVAEARLAELARELAIARLPPVPLGQRVGARVRRVLRRPLEPMRRAAVQASDRFDAAWYKERYADVRQAGMDPAMHYLRSGGAEGRDPGPGFDAGWFVREHPQAARAGVTPLEFYERNGRAAGWATMPPAAVAVPAAPDDGVAAAAAAAAAVAVAEEPVATAAVEAPVVEHAVAALVPMVLFVSGEPESPGSTYRCERYADSARRAGWRAEVMPIADVRLAHLREPRVVVLWRAQFSVHTQNIITIAKEHGAVVVFDIDDLMFRPELARISVIDGIRSNNLRADATRETFARVQQTLERADVCSATTAELAAHMREFQKASYVLPNGFDEAAYARSRTAALRRARRMADKQVRVGYASGTLTHQKDFAVALPGLLRVMAIRQNVLLVLFRAAGGVNLVETGEFEVLEPYRDRIEWRDAVALADLPDELARFDINIAPLETGNPFCEAKSELKVFEAAIVDVPTVASPTGPFARAIAHGVNGLLASGNEGWEECLLRLVDDAPARRRMGQAAHAACLWAFGPARRDQLTGRFLQQALGGMEGTQAFAVQLQIDALPARAIELQPVQLLIRHEQGSGAKVTVVVPCYNYAPFVIEALESVRAQTLEAIDLVVVDDCSTDPLVGELLMEWMRRHAGRFGRAVLVRHEENAGLSAARNTGFALAETPYVLPLDADNRLHRDCCGKLLAALDGSGAAFAYPSLRMFGASGSVFGDEAWRPQRLVGGNYVDAMALIAKWAWSAAGGYDMPRSMGWEDFDLWCALAERGQHGVWVAEVLGEYRVHAGSMVETLVEVEEGKQRTVALCEARHGWLRLSSRTAKERV